MKYLSSSLHLTLLTCFVAFSLGCVLDGNPEAEAPAAEFTPLFDGKTLDGWRSVGGDAEYLVQDKTIIGICDKTARNTFLRTEKTYSDFEFRCQFRWDHVSNSGIQYRSHQKVAKDGKETGRVYGYQFELDPSKRAWSGGLYEEGRRGWLANLEGEKNKAKRAAIKLDDWNDVVIRCEGNRIQTWLNGVAIVDHTDNDKDKALTEGFIALQVHSGNKGIMKWRDLKIKELDKD